MQQDDARDDHGPVHAHCSHAHRHVGLAAGPLLRVVSATQVMSLVAFAV